MPDYLSRPVYSASQIQAYYDCISLPSKWRLAPGHASQTTALDSRDGLAYLTALQQYQLASIPFENLELHYSAHREVSIEPQEIYRKIVGQSHGRGGHCMEANGLFGTVLRTLGFDAFPVGARVCSGNRSAVEGEIPQYSGWSHMLHIVIFGTQRYVVDVGFGIPGMTSPLVLHESSAVPSVNVGPQMRRLRRDYIPDTIRQAGSAQFLWIYEIQDDPQESSPWKPAYCFTELEFLPSDFEKINFFICHSPRSWFCHDVVSVKFIMEHDKIVGSKSLFNRDLKIREHGEKIVDKRLESENERIESLSVDFGIGLTSEERKAISGFESEIR